MRAVLSLLAVACFLVPVLSVPPDARGQARGEPERVAQAEPEILLEGVIVASSSSSSIALVRRQGARRGRSVRVGDTIYGWTLIEVSEESALFERDGERIRIFLDEGGKPAVSPVVAEASDTARVDSPREPGISNGSAEGETWVIRKLDRSSAEERLNEEMPVILAETGIAPRVESGESGLQITYLPDGTLLSELGLLPGDVLLSINDVNLDSLGALADLYPNLKYENEIRVVVERRGRIVKLAYDIR